MAAWGMTPPSAILRLDVVMNIESFIESLPDFRGEC